jgi:hypothetical protein
MADDSKAARLHEDIKALEIKLHKLLGEEPQAIEHLNYRRWLTSVRNLRTLEVGLRRELWRAVPPNAPEWIRDTAWTAYQGAYELERMTR